MAYEAVQVHDLDGKFLGLTIRNNDPSQSRKLHTSNLWTESPVDQADIKEQLTRLNQAVDIRAFWPNVRDPEVQALLNDPTYHPARTEPVRVVDESASVFVWIEEPSDENPTGRMDEDASVIIYKTVEAPIPTDVKARVKKACEQVARKRAAEAVNG